MSAFTYTKFQLSSLCDIAKNITEVEGKSNPASLRLYPRNTPEILINLADPLEGELSNKKMIAKECTIQGSKTDYANVRHPKECHFISIRFTPNGFYKLFGIPQNRFTDNLYRLENVSNNAGMLIPLLKSASGKRGRFCLVQEWLEREASAREIPSDLLSDYIINQLSRNPSESVNELAGKTGYSRKHLAQCFKEEAGLTIKQFQKINRMYGVLKQIDIQNPESWAKLACDFGFYDQSHFIREFKNHTGYTPTDYTQPVTTQKV